MSIKSIIIDNKQTTAKRIALDKVQLDLVALPLDEQNDTEPNLDIRLYVNGQLLKNLQSGADGVVKEMLVIDSVGLDQLTITLEDVVQGVKSKIKYVLIQDKNIEKQKPLLENENKALIKQQENDIKKKEILYFNGEMQKIEGNIKQLEAAIEREKKQIEFCDFDILRMKNENTRREDWNKTCSPLRIYEKEIGQNLGYISKNLNWISEKEGKMNISKSIIGNLEEGLGYWNEEKRKFQEEIRKRE